MEMLSSTQVRAETRVAVEMAYQKKVEPMLNDENCYKILFVSIRGGRRCAEREYEIWFSHVYGFFFGRGRGWGGELF